MNIKSRNAITGIILSIVTCGIYGIYWMFVMAKEAASVKDSADSGILEFILMLLLPFVGWYMLEKKFAEGCAAKGIEHKDNSILFLILGLVLPVVNFYLMQTELNKLAEA